MKALVIDGSTALGFLMADDRAPGAVEALDAIERGVPTLAPSHWPLEVANGLLMAERRRRATQADVAASLDAILELPIDIDRSTAAHAAGATIGLAHQHGLTIYDAAYLELAMRMGATLATTDAALARAAKKAGVSVL